MALTPAPSGSSAPERKVPELDLPPAVRPRAAPLPVTAARAVKRRRLDEATRTRAIRHITGVVSRYLLETPLVRQVLAEEGSLSSDSPSVSAIFEIKSTVTLCKRAYSLLLYVKWFESCGLDDNAFASEPALFAYMSHLNETGAPATRGSAAREALHLICGLLGRDPAPLRSSRIHGLSVRLLRTRGTVRHRRPLTVSMVRALEHVVHSADRAGDTRAIIAGAALFCTYSRARVGDLARCCIEPALDIRADGKSGYIETHFVDHKTARPGAARALPMTASAFGLSSASWAIKWLAARREAGLRAQSSVTLLPAHDAVSRLPQAVAHPGVFHEESLVNVGAPALSPAVSRGVLEDFWVLRKNN